MVYGVLYSIGYLTYDIHYNAVVIAGQKGMQMETIIHHFLAIAALVIALLSGFDMIGVAAGFMLCEISSIFLSFKLMFDVKGK